MHSPSIRTPSIFHLSLKQRTLHSTTLTNIYIHSLMRTKISTVSGDDQSHHHSGLNKIVKIYLYTQNTEQFIVLTHTHTHTHTHTNPDNTHTQTHTHTHTHTHTP